jgi:hypothetical protein
MRRATASVAGVAGVLLLATAACGSEVSGTLCPAIGWSNSLTVRLAADWPSGPDRLAAVTCQEACGPGGLHGEPGSRELVAPVVGTAEFALLGQPASVVVTVREAGTPVAEVDADLDWRRIGGSAECGGPGAATVTVPAP